VQPRFEADLVRSIVSLDKVFAEIRKRLYKNPKKTDLEEISSYLIDILSSLHAFVHVYPEGSLIFGREHFTRSLALTYDVVLPKFADKVQQKLRRAFLNLGRKIIQYYVDVMEGKEVLFEKLPTPREEDDLEEVANDFFEMMRGKKLSIFIFCCITESSDNFCGLLFFQE
jgi:hypothetical protein